MTVSYITRLGRCRRTGSRGTSASHLRDHHVQLLELGGELVHFVSVAELIQLVLLAQTSLQLVQSGGLLQLAFLLNRDRDADATEVINVPKMACDFTEIRHGKKNIYICKPEDE